MAEGYEITRDVTADCPAEITCEVTVREGATLTVAAGCELHFLPKGKLIVEGSVNHSYNGNLVIESGALLSHVKTYVSVSEINQCIFYKSTFLSDQTDVTGGLTPFTMLNDNHFAGDGSETTALQLKKTTTFKISGNTIAEYNTGISLSNSGMTLAPDEIFSSIIDNNDISDCKTGIELYNSVALFDANDIYANVNGVRLLNNSYTVFGPWDEPVSPYYQTVRDCESIEFYTDEYSFPVLFRYNLIKDDNNLGNAHNDPLIWWDYQANGPIGDVDVQKNCWGDNFAYDQDLYPPNRHKHHEYTWCPDDETADFLATRCHVKDKN